MSLIHAATGLSRLTDLYRAGIEAAEEAVDKIKGKPDALLVFASSSVDHDGLLSGIQSVVGDIPLAGGTTAASISTQGYSDDAVVILALRSSTLRFVTAVAQGIRHNDYDCALRFVNGVKSQCGSDDMVSLIVLADGLGGDGMRVIHGLQAGLLTPIDLVGGFLSTRHHRHSTSQYCNGKVYRNAVTGLAICAPAAASLQTGIGVGSGFSSIGNSMCCTAAEGNVIKEIDHEPALDIYMDLLGEDRAKRLPQVCLEYPFGLVNASVPGTHPSYLQIRSGVSVDFVHRTITTAGPIPQGSAMALTTCSRGDLIDGARKAARQALGSLDGHCPELVIVFSCVGRKIVLGRRVGEEVDAVREILGLDVPIIGLYTYGEISPVDSLTGGPSPVLFHNETVVVWALGSRRPSIALSDDPGSHPQLCL